jgi:MFS family permease
VQTALMLPMMLISVPAGAIADMYDRRRIALTGLGFAVIGGALLTALSFSGLGTPPVLLAFCAFIGIGVALYGPAWSASISEQVTPEHLPAAVALGSVSYNAARSIGPAIGGLIVAAAGAPAAFAVTTFAYLPLLAAFYLWRRAQARPRLPPERIDRAIISGARYALHSAPVRAVLVRAFLFGLGSASVSALAPLVARDLLGGSAGTYGLLLGCTGVGAIAGALLTHRVQERVRAETTFRFCLLLSALMAAMVGISRELWLTCLVLVIFGASTILGFALLNVNVQMSVPRWVAARALAGFQACSTAGVGIGAWIWGRVTTDSSVDIAFFASAASILVLWPLGRWMPLRQASIADTRMVALNNEPEVALPITTRSGPVVIEIDYRVESGVARQFYDAMLRLQRTRLRNGAFDWSLSRDIADPELWTERFHFPTWGDYLHLRSRVTQRDHELQDAANAFSLGGQSVQIRRRLERPHGSVRWQADTPDPHSDSVNIYNP